MEKLRPKLKRILKMGLPGIAVNLNEAFQIRSPLSAMHGLFFQYITRVSQSCQLNLFNFLLEIHKNLRNWSLSNLDGVNGTQILLERHVVHVLSCIAIGRKLSHTSDITHLPC